MDKVFKIVYAVTLVIPIVKNALVHLVLFVADTIKEIKEAWKEGWGRD